MSAVIRQPSEPNEEERLLAANLEYRKQLQEEYEQDSLDTRRAIFAYATFGVILIGAFFAVGVILSPGFTIF